MKISVFEIITHVVFSDIFVIFQTAKRTITDNIYRMKSIH